MNAGEHPGTRAVQRMVEYAPSTGGLALWVHHARAAEVEGEDALPLQTDGHTLLYGPGFDDLPLDRQTGHVAHAVLHIALRHPQRYLELQHLLGDADLVLFNVCADAIVNSALSHLSWLDLGERAVTLRPLLQRALDLDVTEEQALLEWDVERLYRAVDDRHGRSRGRRAERARALARRDTQDLRPDAHAAEAPELAGEQAREWQQRLLRAHAGDGAHSMLRALLADLPQVRTPWEQVLRRRLARALAPEPALSWSRPSRSYLAHQGRFGPGRRMPWEPGHTASKAVPRLALVVDVSGSIEAELMSRFSGEIEALLRRVGAGLVLVLGDERVLQVQTLLPGRVSLSALRELGVRGGGGTDFTPLLQEADRHDPDLTVVLTDLDGPARFRPRAPVLWALPPAHAQATAPFGAVLRLR